MGLVPSRNSVYKNELKKQEKKSVTNSPMENLETVGEVLSLYNKEKLNCGHQTLKEY